MVGRAGEEEPQGHAYWPRGGVTLASVLDLSSRFHWLRRRTCPYGPQLCKGEEIKIARERGQRLGCGERACLSHDSLRPVLRGPGCRALRRAPGGKAQQAGPRLQGEAEAQGDLCETSHRQPPIVKASRTVTLEKTVVKQRCRAFQQAAKAEQSDKRGPGEKSKWSGQVGPGSGQDAQFWLGAKRLWTMGQ